MCGIIYAKNITGKEPVNSLVKMLYQNQKDRGKEGFGFVGMNEKKIHAYKATQEKGIMGYLNDNPYSEILFHHRNPTSTGNTIKSAHPFIIQFASKTYYFIHNGIIQNADELQKEHKAKNIAYESQGQAGFNDSEALAWDFGLWINNQQGEMKAKGIVAFMCLETDEKNRALRLYFYRNSQAPLKVYRDRNLLVISSEGGYPALKEDALYFWDYQSRKILKKGSLKIACESESNVYDFYMYDERADYYDVSILEEELISLKQEQDYLVSSGCYDEADYVREEIEDLSYQLKLKLKGRI